MKQMLMSQLAVQIRGVSYKPDDLHKGLDENSIALLRANNINDGEINFNDLVYVDRSKVSNNQLLRQGDILICASSGSKNLVGKAAQVDFNREITFGAFCKVVRPTTVESDYLGMYFQSPIYRKIVSSLAQGANINNIKNADIDNLLVNIPNNDTKKKIVEIFKRMQSIIRNRQQQLQKLDELVKARFVELFGDCVLNTKGWKTKRLGDIAEVGSSKRVFVEDLKETGIPFYRGTEIGALAEGKTVVPELFISEEHYSELCKATGFPKIGDFLMPSICPDGRIWIVNTSKPFYFKDGRVLWVHAISSSYNPVFLLYTLKDRIMTDYSSIASGTTFAELKIFALKECRIFDVPLELQNQFAAFVEQVDKSKLSPYRDCWTRCNFCLAVWCDNTSNKEDIMEWLMNLDPSIWAALIGAVGAIIVALIKVIIPLFKKKEKASDKVAPSINQTVTGNGNTVIGIQNNMKGEKDGQ